MHPLCSIARPARYASDVRLPAVPRGASSSFNIVQCCFAGEIIHTSGRFNHSSIIGHRILGSGFLESIYENALVIELKKCGLEIKRVIAAT